MTERPSGSPTASFYLYNAWVEREKRGKRDTEGERAGRRVAIGKAWSHGGATRREAKARNTAQR